MVQAAADPLNLGVVVTRALECTLGMGRVHDEVGRAKQTSGPMADGARVDVLLARLWAVGLAADRLSAVGFTT